MTSRLQYLGGYLLSGIALVALWGATLAVWLLRRPGDPEPLIETVTLVILAGLPWLAACWLSHRHKTHWGWIAAVALAVRVMAWQLPPVFTDDLLRYRWEGRLQAAGGNPYAVRPIDHPELLRHEDHHLPGRDIKAVYGPLTLLTEHLAYQVSQENLRHLRWPFALADLLAAALLLSAFRHRAIAYAWCPLPVFEFWMHGHNDALCVLALAAAIIAFDRQRPTLGWIALSAAVMTKWWPLMLAPLLAGRDASRWRTMPWLATGAVLFLPYGLPPLDNAQFATGFLGGWRNNDSLFGALLWLSGGDLYRAKYAGFTLLAVWIVWLACRDWTTNSKCIAAIAGLLTVSANVHPWYLAWFTPFLPETPLLFPFVWVALSALYYEPVLIWRTAEVWTGVRDSRWLATLPAAFALLLPRLVSTEGARTK